MKSAPNADIFNALVWEIARQVPLGKVTTYGQIASTIPLLTGIDPADFDRYGAQWVGAAMNICPEDVPWQRVINSKGEISLPEPTGMRQRQLLEGEGVIFDIKARVNFEVVGWDGPDAEWAEQYDLRQPSSLKKKKKSDAPEQPKLF